MAVYKSLNIKYWNIKGKSRNVKICPDHLKTKTLCKHAVTNMHYLLRCVPGKCKTQEMCNKPILETFRTLESSSGCCRNQEMCNKAIGNYPHALELVP